MDPSWTPLLLAIGAALVAFGVQWALGRILRPYREARGAGSEQVRASIALERERLDASAAGVRREAEALEAELAAAQRAADPPHEDGELEEGEGEDGHARGR